MRILITGNMGYVGPVLVSHLRHVFPTAVLIGLDSGLYASQLTVRQPFPERLLDQQIFADVRDVGVELIRGVDAVIHLAAVSNDPMGHAFEAPTKAINFLASKRLAELSAEAGVKHFVFASSCSIYGSGGDTARREGDQLNPLTAYAQSKINTENALSEIASPSMMVTCLRFATARGMSPRLRLDLVLNDFVATALRTGDIKVISDGTPWRPLIDVSDMALAMEWAITRNDGPRFLAINTGADSQNYAVSEIAKAVATAAPGTGISINSNAAPDLRSYRVDFGLFKQLAPHHQPRKTLQHSIDELLNGISQWPAFSDYTDGSETVRLRTLKNLMATGALDNDLRWIHSKCADHTDSGLKVRSIAMLQA